MNGLAERGHFGSGGCWRGLAPGAWPPINTGFVNTMDTNEPTRPSRIGRWKWLLYVGAGAVILVAARYFHAQDLLRQALAWVSGLGWIGVLLFIAIYVIATVLLVPGSALTLGAGAAFGVACGSVYVSIASVLGATCAFLVSRHLARDAVARRIKDNERFTAIDRAVATGGWKIVGLTRLSPIFPFTLLNYAFGLTRVSLLEYVIASWIGMMPGTVLFVYLGSLAQAAAGQRTRTPLEWGLYGVGLLATVAVTLVITRLARRELSKSLDL